VVITLYTDTCSCTACQVVRTDGYTKVDGGWYCRLCVDEAERCSLKVHAERKLKEEREKK